MPTTGVFNGTNLVLQVEGNSIGHTTSCSLSYQMIYPKPQQRIRTVTRNTSRALFRAKYHSTVWLRMMIQQMRSN